MRFWACCFFLFLEEHLDADTFFPERHCKPFVVCHICVHNPFGFHIYMSTSPTLLSYSVTSIEQGGMITLIFTNSPRSSLSRLRLHTQWQCFEYGGGFGTRSLGRKMVLTWVRQVNGNIDFSRPCSTRNVLLLSESDFVITWKWC